MTQMQVCPGCGSRLPQTDGGIHAYMLSSPACWAAFNTVMAREYSDPSLMLVHRLSVDAWAVQHPGDGSRRAIQSVGLHLARLMLQLEGGAGQDANAAMLKFTARKSELPELPPRGSYTLTVANVVGATEPEQHRQAVREWAEATWNDWTDQHGFIRQWAGNVLGRP